MVKKIEFTKEGRASLVAEYRAGSSIRELSRVWGYSYGTIRANLLAANVKLRGQGGSRKVSM